MDNKTQTDLEIQGIYIDKDDSKDVMYSGQFEYSVEVSHISHIPLYIPVEADTQKTALDVAKYVIKVAGTYLPNIAWGYAVQDINYNLTY